jgi:hypothetical protein
VAAAPTCNQPAASGDYVRCGANPLARAGTFHNDSGLYEVSIGDPDVQYDAPFGRWLAFWSTGLQTTYTAKNQTMAVKKATSTDGVAWAPSLEPVLRTSASPTAWDFSKAETPTVVRLPPALRTAERQWLMLYSGANAAASAGHGAFSADPWYQLGAAFSADGERFVKLPAAESPYYRGRSRGAYASFSVEGLVLMGADTFPGLSGVADGLVADPELVVDDDGRTLHLFMSSLAMDASSSALRYGISHATSTTGWMPSAANPVVNGGAGPSVLRDAAAGGWQLFFLQDSAADKAKVPTTFNPELGVWAANASGLRGPWTRQIAGPGAGGREVSWCASCGPEKLGWVATGDFAFNAPGGERRWYFVAFDPAPPIPSGWVAPVIALRHPLGLEPAVIALSMAHRTAPVKTDEAAAGVDSAGMRNQQQRPTCCGAVAVASCFGWSATNATVNTAAIQAALDCSLAHTVIVPKMPGPWIVEPPAGSGELGPTKTSHAGKIWKVAALNFSRAASNKTVIFKAGSTVQAARWSFAEEKASLAIVGGLWSKAENLSIVGENGASWRMHKADYQNASGCDGRPHSTPAHGRCYSKSEWRHGLSIWWGESVTVSGLTIAETGGDGIMVGG